MLLVPALCLSLNAPAFSAEGVRGAHMTAFQRVSAYFHELYGRFAHRAPSRGIASVDEGLPGDTISACGHGPDSAPLRSQLSELDCALSVAPVAGMKSSEELDQYLEANQDQIMATPEDMKKYRIWIRAAAESFGIPEAALLCNLAKETNFKRTAVSSTHARGLAQFTMGSRQEASNIISGKVRGELVPAASGLKDSWEAYFKKVNPSGRAPEVFTADMALHPMESIGGAALWYRYTLNSINKWTRKPPDLNSYTLTAGAYNRGRGAPSLYCSARSFYGRPEKCIGTGLDDFSSEGIMHMHGVDSCMRTGNMAWVQRVPASAKAVKRMRARK